MSRTLELPDDLADALAGDASRLGLSMPDYAVRLLTSARAARNTPIRTGAELVAYWEDEGVVGSRPDIVDSVAHSRSLREQAERRGG